ncbi:hypothetical protein FAM09_19010 [Niastella caeni]|uniref:Peptidase S74 domain-containing protein n=1 Tax=Niastella caeni TaxID=2569763 RepID=A0A4V4H0L1_9BACT|nr:tail fiber domain-containing protein [Niastella caeni]THU37046.1 hypothetical protein FAM09_19010 [Niastella caeni]
MTKYYIAFLALIMFMTPCVAQNVAINEDGSLPDPKAILDVKSYTKGVLIPRMSSADRWAIKAPKGLLVYDTTTNSFWYSSQLVVVTPDSSYTVWENLATGYGWSVGGNHIGDSNSSYLGTKNRIPLRIKVNAVNAGIIDPVGKNTFWGYESGTFTPAYRLDTPGICNTGTGNLSLHYNNNGSYNTAAGDKAMMRNRSGNFNTATGANALHYNTTGNTNVANGSGALYVNSTGSLNTAVGGLALYNNRTGSYNTGIGYNTSLTRDSFSNATAIGYGAIVNASNKVRIGNSAVTSIEGPVAFSVVSDGRFKYSVKEDVKGLDFILQLRPVTYQFDVKRFNTQYSLSGIANENGNGNYALQTAYDEASSIRRSGFIAQEVEKAAVASGYNFSGVVQPKTAQEHYSLSYEAFVVPLVKAVQELSEKNKKLEQEIAEIKQLLQKLK